MSNKERIGLLEDLLARVQRRAVESRTNGHGAQAAAPMAAPAAHEGVEAELEEIDVIASPAPAPVHARAAEPAAKALAYESADADDSDVEVSSEVVELEMDEIDEATAFESGAQLVAQPVGAEDVLEEVEEEQPEAALLEAEAAEAPPLEEEEPVVHATAANEVEEPAPSSSRRPKPTPEAYEGESAPRHTPPPESGKQVAASPSGPPRIASFPPSSLPEHTLVGGWREPGLGASPIAPTGVRVPAPAVVAPPPPPVAPEPSAAVAEAPVSLTEPPATIAQASELFDVVPSAPLAPEVTRPDLHANAAIASFQGAPPVAKPATLGALLDMTLAL